MGSSDNYTINLVLSSGIGGNGGTPGTVGFPSNYTFDYVHYSTLTGGLPNAVTGLTASQVFSNAVQLNWTASTTPGVTYNIYASTTPNATLDLSTLIEQNASATSLLVSALNPSTQYYFTVLASNWGGEAAVNSGDTVTATTAAPGNGTSVLLSAGGYAVDGYMNSQFVTGGNTNYHLPSNTIPPTVVIVPTSIPNPAPVEVYTTERWGPASWNIPNLTPGASYNVRLHFVESTHTAAGQRAFSVAINGATVLTNFDIFATAGAQNTVVTQTFPAIADGNGAIGIQTLMGTTSAGDLNPTVSAIDVTPLVVAPNAPVNLVASTGSTSEIDLTWTASSTFGVKYLVFRSTTSGFTPAASNQITPSAISATSFADTSLTAATTYYYVVEATNVNGTSAASNQAAATTTVSGPVLPAAPTNLAASAVSTSGINLTWTASTTAGVQYLVFRSTSIGFTPAASNQITPSAISATTFSDTGLTASTPYYYVVEATNANGNSAPSNMATATVGPISTPPNPSFTLSFSANSLTLTAGTNGSETVTVTPINGFLPTLSITFACYGLPSNATCSFSQTTINAAGNMVATLTINTTAPVAALHPRRLPFFSSSPLAFPGSALALSVCFVGWKKRRGMHRLLLLLVFGIVGLSMLNGCGAGSPTKATTGSTTPAASTVVVVAKAGNVTQVGIITLTVQ